MLLVTFVQVVFAIAAVYFGARVAMAFGRDVRGALFHRVTDFSAQDVARFGAPSLITRITNDVHAGADPRPDVVHAARRRADHDRRRRHPRGPRGRPALAAPARRACPVLVISVGLVISRMVPQFQVMQERIDRINQILREQITGHARRAGVRPRARRSRALRRRQRRADDDVVARRAPDGVHVPDRHARAQRVERRRDLVRRQPHRRRRHAGRRADRVPQLPHPDPDVGDDGDVRRRARAPCLGQRRAHRGGARRGVVGRRRRRTRSPRSAPTSSLELRDVEFEYPGADYPVLCDISFKAVAGQTTAIIGSTGSGKTTLLNLVPRLFDATGGTVLVDGVDVRDIEPELLWSRIGLVPQKPYLFSGTVASNLRYANPDATDEELWARARGRAGARLRVRDARAARRADQPGRLQRVRRAAPAPRDRPRARPPAGHLPVRRLVLRARPRDRRAAAGRARRRWSRTR